MTTKQYKGVASAFKSYWHIYGGFKVLVGSPYLHFSIAVSVILWPIWNKNPDDLYNLTAAIVPSVLGFSLGGYAILLAFGDDQFRRIISGPDPDGTESPFMDVNAAFIHFIVVSAIALVYSIAGLAWSAGGCIAFLGCILLVYSIACALASAFAIFEVAGWFDHHIDVDKKRSDPPCKK